VFLKIAFDPGGAPIDALQDVLSNINNRNKEAKSIGGVSSFFLSILNEPRKIICGKGKNPKKFGSGSHAVLSGVAAAIAKKFGISDPAAIGLAVLVLMTLGQATKNAFCKKKDTEVLKTLEGLNSVTSGRYGWKEPWLGRGADQGCLLFLQRNKACIEC
jgi:hypothetical protein